MRLRLFATIVVLCTPSLALAQLDNKCNIDSCTECNCYWSSECGSGQSCDYGSGCTHVGKKDGTCKASGSGGGISPGSAATAATAMGLWLEAYQSADEDKGLPDKNVWNRIQALNLSQADKRRVQLAAFNVIDVLLGFDFAHPRGNCDLYDARCLGILRVRPDRQSRQLLKFAGSGLTQAVRTGSARTVQRELATFWRSQRNFRPHHTGRCYPHGHSEFKGRTPLQCQTDELTRIVQDLLAYQKPAAGM